jgi:hypothetical protein
VNLPLSLKGDAMPSLLLVFMCLAAGADPLGDEFYQDFRKGPFDDSALRVAGPKGKYTEKTPQGLHITLPAGPKAVPPVGVAYERAVHGDFEIAVSYQLGVVAKPEAGYGAGISLQIAMEDPADTAVTLARHLHAKGGDRYSTNITTNAPDGTRKHQVRLFPTQNRAGRLRLVRAGTQLIFSVADDNEPDFRELRRAEFGRQPLKAVRALADGGGSAGDLEVYLQDLRIRSDEQSVSADVTRESTMQLWWIVIGAVTAGAALGVGTMLVRLPRRRARVTPVPQRPAAATGKTSPRRPRSEPENVQEQAVGEDRDDS